MNATYNLTLKLKRDTSVGVLGILGVMAAYDDPTVFGPDVGEKELKHITDSLRAGFCVPMMSHAADGAVVMDRQMPFSPSFFIADDWASLFSKCTIAHNLDKLTEDSIEPIEFSVSGTKSIDELPQWLAFVRWVREHQVAVTQDTTVLTVTEDDGTSYVVSTPDGLKLNYDKRVNDIVQPLDVRWDIETPYSQMVQSIMTELVKVVRVVTNDTMVALGRRKKKKKDDKHTLFIQQTGLNKLLIEYAKFVSYSTIVTGADLPWVEGEGDGEYDYVRVDPGLAHILGDLVAGAIKRMTDGGVLKEMVVWQGRTPYGNVNRINDALAQLDLLFPSAKAEPLKNQLRAYYGYY